jgi:hypothetical protein
MMMNRKKNALKGHHHLAQGKRSGAPGWKADWKIVCAVTFIKKKILLRAMKMTFCLPEMMFCNSVRKEFFALFIESLRTFFLLHTLLRATFRFVPPSTCPGLKSIGLSGRKNIRNVSRV